MLELLYPAYSAQLANYMIIVIQKFNPYHNDLQFIRCELNYINSSFNQIIKQAHLQH
jgi:hypothetical protein